MNKLVKNYEKLYKEALERAEIWQDHLNESGNKDYADELNYIFPELAESEDEKIRKGIIRNLEYLMNRAEGFVKDELKKRIAWLEKQGEQKVSYTTTVETGDGGINALVTKDIEIPFGAKDSELQEVSYYIPKGYYAKIEGDKVVIKKSEENPATIDVDKMVGDYAKSNVRDNEEFGKPLPCMIRAYRQGLNDAINGKNDGSERL